MWGVDGAVEGEFEVVLVSVSGFRGRPAKARGADNFEKRLSKVV